MELRQSEVILDIPANELQFAKLFLGVAQQRYVA
jgi:hypothetical protein